MSYNLIFQVKMWVKIVSTDTQKRMVTPLLFMDVTWFLLCLCFAKWNNNASVEITLALKSNWLFATLWLLNFSCFTMLTCEDSFPELFTPFFVSFSFQFVHERVKKEDGHGDWDFYAGRSSFFLKSRKILPQLREK